MKRIVLTCVTSTLLLAACSSGGSSLFTLEKTKSCLTAHTISLGGTLDFVATTATGGALRAHLQSNFVTVAFGATEADADNINQAYRSFRAENVGIDDVLRQERNAVMLWHEHPSDADLATIAGCLK